ncbi:ABC transporter permease [Hydrocarboniclastica marina]|uniref:Transport permease protein n=1 Tax=Hydrocarboniclastica marina TaxID=2259620 RepID=A0A4P7XI35_9ALTE|nr:ABC transporter permease [Hydrocarboniclastica marina]MAL97654.1 phosphate ABC transporter permease [Alteromonadaceae bacterium]QCF26739.1 ABC transporter permease [Hydrocarboniclastica marina]|tara:strand:- start:55 stop:906 length:852 start_codon:yes stop_codon:yes gene_type:complete
MSKEPTRSAQDVPVIVIEPHTGWRSVDWRELREYKDLFFFLIWRNIKVRYAQSAIGVGWAVLQPLASMVVFTVIFGNLVGVETDGAPYGVFTFVALVPWTYFANSLTEGASSMVSNSGMISKIYFPRLIMPLAIIGARMVDFMISMVILGCLMLFSGILPNIGILMLPFLVLILTLSAAGLGLWLTALAIQYRDVSYGMTFGVQLLMYAGPVVYPASLIPERWQLLYALNPMVGVIEGFRAGLLGTRDMPWDFIAIGGLVSLLLFVSGTLYFRRKEHIFADVA